MSRTVDGAGSFAPDPGPGAVGMRIGDNDDPDRFEIVAPGLRGGEGYTYRSLMHVVGLRKPLEVAVKQIRRPAWADLGWPDQDDLARWNGQKHVVQSSASPHLVEVREIFLGEPPHQPGTAADLRFARTPYVVMEWVNGESLLELVRHRRRPLADLVELVEQLVDAVGALHSTSRTLGNPMLHGDIKPGNCIVHAARGLVLVDLGSLQPVHDHAHAPRLSTPGYVAPELLDRPDAPRTIESDLYAIGAVMYFCVVGQEPPHDPHDARDRMRAELVVAARRHRLGRSALPDLVLRMLHPQPMRRPRNARSWVADIRRLVQRQRRTRRAAIGIGATAAMLAGAGLVAGGGVAGGGGAPAPPAFTPFGASFAVFEARQDADRIVIAPPLGQNRYDHLWGVHAAGENCATTVEFDAVIDDGDRSNGFGLAVAPRSVVESDQPYGFSVQYEWTPAYVTGVAQSQLRPVELPGGAWVAPVDPVEAPDVDGTHHVVVRAVGTTMEVRVDEVQARFDAPAVECGGVALRAWGAPVTITDLRVNGS